MATLNYQHEAYSENPLDIVENIIERNDWAYERRSDEEIAFQIPGSWCDYSLFFAWNGDVGAMHFSCAFDMRVPAARRAGDASTVESGIHHAGRPRPGRGIRRGHCRGGPDPNGSA